MHKVFVLGVNRSGTHLMMSLLSGHTDLFVVGLEDGMVGGLARQPDVYAAALKSRRTIPTYKAVAGNSAYLKFKLMSEAGQMRASNSKESLPFEFDFDELDRRFIARLWDEQDWQTSKITGAEQLIDAFYQSFAEALQQDTRSYVVAKPTNSAWSFQLVASQFTAGTLRLICLVRDPRDIVSSMLKLEPESSIAKVSDGWLSHMQAVAELEKDFPLHLVRYEDLCRNTEETMRQVCTFLGISYEEVLLVPRLHEQEFSGNSSFESWEGVSTASIGRWHTQLSAPQVKEIETRIGVYLLQAGYDPVNPGVSRRMGSRSTRLVHKLERFFLNSRRRAGAILLLLGLALGIIIGILLTSVTGGS